MEDLFQLDLGAGHAVLCKDLSQLANAFFICSGRAADIEVVADHHDIAALKRAGSLNVFNLLIIEKLLHRADDFVFFAIAGFRAWVSNNRALASNQSRVFHEAGIRIALVRF